MQEMANKKRTQGRECFLMFSKHINLGGRESWRWRHFFSAPNRISQYFTSPAKANPGRNPQKPVLEPFILYTHSALGFAS